MAGALSASVSRTRAAPVGRPKVTPWADWNEWRLAQSLLFSPNPQMRSQGVSLVNMWRSRTHHVPAAVEATAALTESLLMASHGYLRTQVEQHAALSLIRFFNGVVDPLQTRSHAMPMKHLANRLALPPILTELRHAATHRRLPPLGALLHGLELARGWIERHYWLKQRQLVDSFMQPTVDLRETLTGYVGRKRSRRRKSEAPALLEQLCGALDNNSAEFHLVPLIVQSLPADDDEVWQDTLQELQRHFPSLFEALALQLAHACATDNSETRHNVWFSIVLEKTLALLEQQQNSVRQNDALSEVLRVMSRNSRCVSLLRPLLDAYSADKKAEVDACLGYVTQQQANLLEQLLDMHEEDMRMEGDHQVPDFDAVNALLDQHEKTAQLHMPDVPIGAFVDLRSRVVMAPPAFVPDQPSLAINVANSMNTFNTAFGATNELRQSHSTVLDEAALCADLTHSHLVDHCANMANFFAVRPEAPMRQVAGRKRRQPEQANAQDKKDVSNSGSSAKKRNTNSRNSDEKQKRPGPPAKKRGRRKKRSSRKSN
ncbi:MAG: hypothetical protein MHM6MM_005786 [Cercozoa sp. M6MM]